MDETGWLKAIGGGAVVAVLFYALQLLLGRKLRTFGEFEDLVKRHEAEVRRLEADINYWRTRSDVFESKLYEVRTKADDARKLAREAVNEIEKNGQ